MSNLANSAVQRHILHRIGGYIVVLLTFYMTIVSVAGRVEVQLPHHPGVEKIVELGARFLTVWILIAMLMYAFISLLCDVTSLISSQLGSIIPIAVRQLRHTFFHGLIFPMTFGAMVFFWLVYFYDRELIYPKSVDLIMTQFDNFVFHTFSLFFIFWEMAILPKNCHKKTTSDLLYVFLCTSAYVLTTLYTGFVDKKRFPYDILNVTLGTLWFFVIFTGVPCLFVLGYYVQWWYNDFVWKCRDGDGKKIH